MSNFIELIKKIHERIFLVRKNKDFSLIPHFCHDKHILKYNRVDMTKKDSNRLFLRKYNLIFFLNFSQEKNCAEDTTMYYSKFF